jgi:hypothetical protein
MEKPAGIDAFALCASPFAAPSVLALFGLMGSIGQSKGTLFSILFWQVLLAVQWAPIYLAVSLPLGWLLWRVLPTICSSKQSFLLPLLVAVCAFSLVANLRFLGVTAVGPLEPEIFTFLVGVILNAIAFIWLHRRVP